MSEKLEPRQERFCKEYVIDCNGTQAAIRAGYSEHTANEQAARLLAKASVKDRVAELSRSVTKKLEITAERVLLELARLAYFDPASFFKPDGSLVPLNELDEDTRRAMAGIEVVEEFSGPPGEKVFVGYNKKIKLADKGANLERLGRYLKLFSDRLEVTGMEGLVDTIAEARQRANQKEQ